MLSIVLLMSSILLHAATLKDLRGVITVNSVKVDQEREVSEGDIISAIGKKSSVQIFFEDGSRSLLRNGQLIISEERKKEKTLLSLVRGTLFTFKSKTPASLKIKTKQASMGVRGTKFYVEETPGDTYLCVCEGRVEISNAQSSVMVEKNEDVHAKKSEKLQKTQANSDMMMMAWEGFKIMGLKE